NLAVRYMATSKLQSMEFKDVAVVAKLAFSGEDNVWLQSRAIWQLARSAVQRYEKKGLPDALIYCDVANDPRFQLLRVRLAKHVFQGTYQELSYHKDLIDSVRIQPWAHR